MDIRVIDTRVVASPLGTIVEEAAKWAAEGRDVEAVIAGVESLIRRCRLYFLVATMDYLARGGRIGGATHLLGSVLQIKPILAMREGKVDTYEKERTHRRAVARLKEIVCDQAPLDGSALLTVMHADVPDEARAFAAELGRIVQQADVPISDVPPAIVTHGGPGILGVGFFVKE
jgi:DegV family protein with EDD domain